MLKSIDIAYRLQNHYVSPTRQFLTGRDLSFAWKIKLGMLAGEKLRPSRDYITKM
jgi:hypothetical protein